MVWSQNISLRDVVKSKRRNAIFARNTFIHKPCINPPSNPQNIREGEELWITLNLKLLDWSFMDESWTVSVNTKISTLRNYLQEKHGLFHHLIICKDVFSEETELKHDSSTMLQDCGFQGNPLKDNAPSITIYYNFIPSGMRRVINNDVDQWNGILQDPILLC